MTIIMIVEDDADVRDCMNDLISSLGYQAVVCVNGKEALQYLCKNTTPPALIMTNWDMPGMGGEEFLANFWVAPKLAGIPVVVISGNASCNLPSHIEKLKKPALPEDIKRVVRLHLGGGMLPADA